MADPVAGMMRSAPYFKLALLVGVVGTVVVLSRFTPLAQYVTQERVLAVLGAIRSSAWAPGLYVVIYTGATALAFPGSLLTIAGGAVFGFGGGAVLTTVGANLGANAAFGLARALGRDGIERLAGRRLAGLDRATRRHGFTGLLVLRLIPLVPFNALNFGSGLTAIRWRHYALATVLGILPGTLIYTFFANALVEGSTAASEAARTRLWIAGALFVALSLLPIIVRRLGYKPPSDRTSEAV